MIRWPQVRILAGPFEPAQPCEAWMVMWVRRVGDAAVARGVPPPVPPRRTDPDGLGLRQVREWSGPLVTTMNPCRCKAPGDHGADDSDLRVDASMRRDRGCALHGVVRRPGSGLRSRGERG